MTNGCLGLQESFDYVSQDLDPHFNMTVWEFIELRQDVLSIQKAAIEYVDESYPGFKDYYTQTDKKYTYLLMHNNAFTRAELGLFVKYGIKDYKNATIRSLKVEDVKTLLLYSIVEGYYHTVNVDGGVSFSPQNVITLWKSTEAEMTFCMEHAKSGYGAFVVNRNVSSRQESSARNSNHLMTNGAVHIFDYQYFY